jgi:hypothetical protein
MDTSQAPNDFQPIQAPPPASAGPNDFAPIETAQVPAIPPAFIDRVAHGEAAKQSFEEQQAKPVSQRLGEWTEQQINEGNYGRAGVGIASTVASTFVADVLGGIGDAFQTGKDAWDGRLGGFGLRREDFTDIPAEQSGGKSSFGSQPGDEVIGRAFNAAMIFGPLAGRPLVPMAGGEFARLKPDIDGTIKPEPLGPLPPQPEDFQHAATVISQGEPVPQVAAKLDRMWQDHGVTPSEIAHDGQDDPVIKQKMLSHNEILPDIYGGESEGGGGGGKPPEPPARPAIEGPDGGNPPKPGSLEEAQQKILDHISVDEPSAGQPFSWKRLYTNVVDRFFPISDARDGAEFAASEDPYKLARLYSGWTGKADHMLNEGTFDFNSYKDIGPALKDILDPVKDDMDGFRAFIASARAAEYESQGLKHGFDLDAVKTVGQAGMKKYGPTMEKLVNFQGDVLKYLRDSGVVSDKAYDAMREGNKLFVPFHRVMGDDILAGAHSTSGESMTARNPIKARVGSELDLVDPIESIIKNTYMFTAMAEKNAVGTKLVDMLLDQGAAKPIWNKSMGRPVGVPEMLELKGKQDKGEASAIAGFLDHQGAKADPDVVSALQDMATPARDGEISIFRDGTRTSYKVDPDIANAMKGLDRSTMGLIERLLAPLSSTMRAGAVLDPEFAVRHTIRDFLYSFIKTNDGVYTPVDAMKGLVGLITKDADYWKWQKGGGANATIVGLDRRFLQESLSELNDKSGLFDRSWNVIQNPNMTPLAKIGAVTGEAWQAAISPLQMLTEFSMNMNHLGGFKRSLRDLEMQQSQKTGTTLPSLTQPGQLAPRDLVTYPRALDVAQTTGVEKKNILEAAWVSRNTGIDIARMGARMKAWNAISAFANAKIQDTMQIGEALVQTPFSTSTKIAIGITIPSLALWWANKDDSRYQEMPEWEKDVFWIIPTDRWEPSTPELAATRPSDQVRLNGDQIEVNNGTVWRIPKPFSTGVLFGSGAERIAEHFYSQNPDAFKGFFKSLETSTVGDLTPNAIVPVLEQSANRSQFTGRTIISSNLEKQLPEYQYNNYTTETAKKLGQIISAFPGISSERTGEQGAVMPGTARALSSPILIENYMRGWTGALGTYAFQAADFGLRKAGVLPDPEHAEKTMADIPIVRAFVARYPTTNAQSVQNFYQNYDTNKTFYDTYMARAKEGDQAAMQKIQDAGGMRMFVQLDSIKEALGTQSAVMRMIDQNPDMKPYEKRQLIDSLYFGIIQTAKEGNDLLMQVPK